MNVQEHRTDSVLSTLGLKKSLALAFTVLTALMTLLVLTTQYVLFSIQQQAEIMVTLRVPTSALNEISIASKQTEHNAKRVLETVTLLAQMMISLDVIVQGSRKQA